MSDQIHDEEERDLIDMASADLRTMPLYRTAPERIGLAIGDDLEDWNSEFGDCEAGVTWYSESWGDHPVQVCIRYVRADLYDTLRAQLSEAQAVVSVGDSFFESWYSLYNPEGKSTKQTMREAYEAGMVDHEGRCDTAAQVAQAQCETCEELRDNLSDALGGRLHTDDEKSRLIESLLAMIGRISDSLGISAEDQSVASGDEEILDAIEELKAQVAQGVADDVVRDASVGAAIERAARELPFGYDIRIEIERDAGTVSLYGPDCNDISLDFDGDTFAGEINTAVNTALTIHQHDLDADAMPEPPREENGYE